MTAFEDQRSVWTDNQDPDWLAKGPFDPAQDGNMVLAGNMSEHGARFLCERLLWLRPDLKFFVKDNKNRTTDTFVYRPPIQSTSPPRRRSLGGGVSRD